MGAQRDPRLNRKRHATTAHDCGFPSAIAWSLLRAVLRIRHLGLDRHDDNGFFDGPASCLIEAGAGAAGRLRSQCRRAFASGHPPLSRRSRLAGRGTPTSRCGALPPTRAPFPPRRCRSPRCASRPSCCSFSSRLGHRCTSRVRPLSPSLAVHRRLRAAVLGGVRDETHALRVGHSHLRIIAAGSEEWSTLHL